jgi:hypothetical protein
VSTARDWFETDADFRQLCADAQSEARGESSQEFAHQMMLSANARGLDAPLTYKQLAWLCKIADWVIPAQKIS